MEVLRMRMQLEGSPECPIAPEGISLLPFEPDKHCSLVHELLTTSYLNGFGDVPQFQQWWENTSTDPEYDQSLIVLAADRFKLVGVVHCWNGGFVKDLVVSVEARRRGIGAFLLRHCFHTFSERGATAVDLKVVKQNTSAIALYRSVGMTIVDEVVANTPTV